MKLKREPPKRHAHYVTIDDAVWDALREHCLQHNVYPGRVIDAALRKHLGSDVLEEFG